MYIDRHEYQTFSAGDKRLDILGHLYKTLRDVPKLLDKMARRHPLIIGEWSLALDPASFKGLAEPQRAAAYRAYGAAQLITYEETAAWFYWSYKTEGGGSWSFRDVVDKGWLPNLSAVK
jgi:glucan 1,3-beta-glucosidase